MKNRNTQRRRDINDIESHFRYALLPMARTRHLPKTTDAGNADISRRLGTADSIDACSPA